MTENSFYTSIAEYYEQIFPLKQKPVFFIQSTLPVQSVETDILDIGCSTGQLAIALAGLGYTVTGIDQDEEMIRIAKSKSAELRNPVFLSGNMLDLRATLQNRLFDGILCFGNTIPHLSDEMEIFKFFQEVFLSLKRSGKFLFQTVNYSLALKNRKHSFPVIDNKAVHFEREYEFSTDTPHIVFKTKLTVKANQLMITNAVRHYPVVREDIHRLLIEAGFSRMQLFGNFEKSPFYGDSPAMVVMAE